MLTQSVGAQRGQSHMGHSQLGQSLCRRRMSMPVSQTIPECEFKRCKKPFREVFSFTFEALHKKKKLQFQKQKFNSKLRKNLLFFSLARFLIIAQIDLSLSL